MDVKWKPIIGYEGLYMASTDGCIKSLDRYVPTKSKKGLWSKRLIKGKILKPCMNKGYCHVTLAKNGTSKNMIKVHRIIAKTFIENPENKPCVNHIDGNPSNNDITNLEWCTHKENMNHAYKAGLLPEPPTFRGEKSNFAKLKTEQVKEIKDRLKAGESAVKIASDYSVSDSCIKEIKAGRSWAHL
jgi:hypothetical protein